MKNRYDVVIVGAGPAGIAYTQLAKCCGASKVIVAASGKERIEHLKKVGPDVIIDIRSEDVYSRVMEETGGIGARYSIDAAGSVSSITMAVRACANGGDVFYYGIPGENDKIDFPVTEIILKHLNIHGVCGNYMAWEPFVSLVASGQINVKDMITHEYKLEDLWQAVEKIKNRDKSVIKAVIVFD